jgi:hypothetical protein
MIDLILLLIINSLVCFGFWNACLYIPEVIKKTEYHKCAKCFEVVEEEQKGVLWFIEKWAKDKWFYKPLCGCLPCMASFHSSYVYWAFQPFTLESLIIYPVYILALSGLNYLIESFR